MILENLRTLLHVVFMPESQEASSLRLVNQRFHRMDPEDDFSFGKGIHRHPADQVPAPINLLPHRLIPSESPTYKHVPSQKRASESAGKLAPIVHKGPHK